MVSNLVSGVNVLLGCLHAGKDWVGSLLCESRDEVVAARGGAGSFVRLGRWCDSPITERGAVSVVGMTIRCAWLQKN